MSDKPAKTYKVIRLESENIKRLKAVSIEPGGNVIEITGKNGAGKTSVLDSLFWALTGKTATKQPSPIRTGEEKATITLDLGSLTVTRKFLAQEDGSYTTSLVVETEDGARFQKPQNTLDALVGSLTMDPLEFTRMKPADQFDALRRFVPNFDFEKSAGDNAADFRTRTDVNRRAKETRAQAAGIVVAAGTPDEPIDESALVDDLQAAGDHNADIERRKSNRAAVASQILAHDQAASSKRAQITVLEQQIAALRLAAEEDIEAGKKLQKRLDDAGPLPDLIDQTEIRAKISAARVTNGAVAEKKRSADLLAAAGRLEQESAALTKAMADRDAEKAKAIAAAKMPVDGIGFGDGIITLNDLPFDQASAAEQLRASIALAMAANPKLRIILVRDGSLLDDDSIGIIAEMADKHDIQIWMETVSSGRAGAIVIEDGAIRQEKALEAAE
ncbi:AAA family ATPase [Mesorhizobium sp.]|uniref:AAA family ATPase n=1 Tax=Mesorhizobium sp. TaxID=1871066 RepID=UPI001211CDF5|nr:AAA family ATPase [Mesorhizobium sp.]TIX28803.1 MAG: hypothetical protein E5V35_00140 [Mesorhizobium sp.]